ncbi:MAG: competence/damage-inducible protein A [Gammaproteobacteria bacterium]
MNSEPKNAGVVVIGNEILSGRTQDSNLSFIGGRLSALGIILREARVIPDVEATIISTVRQFSGDFDYVFTTGGIGPTHDDITTACVASAFNRKIIRDPEAVKAMDKYYEPGQLTEARLKMADVPEGATLVPNPVSAAPGYQVENVFVLAGVPDIMRAMFLSIEDRLTGGPPILSASVSTNLGESRMASGLGEIKAQCSNVDIGSYPYFKQGQLGVNIVLRSIDKDELLLRQQQVIDLVALLEGITLDVMQPD